MKLRTQWLVVLPLILLAALFPALEPVIASGVQAAARLIVGSTAITGGTNGDCLYDNGPGTLGEKSCGGGGSSLTVGSTTISGGTNGDCLYDNGPGVLGETSCGSGGTLTVGSTSISGGSVGDCLTIAAGPVLGAASCGGGGGGLTFPFTIVQQSQFTTFGNETSFPMVFPQATAASGNTAFILACVDGNESITLPSGWTSDLNVVGATYARLVLIHKATASDTSATITTTMQGTFQSIFFELSGSHSLDQSATGTTNNVQGVSPGAITPTAGAAVFAMACVTGSGTEGSASSQLGVGGWSPLFNVFVASGARQMVGEVYQGTATNISTTPPPIGFGWLQLFSSTGGISFASFSII
jgi:hypothetical protein